jgi:hypothetical protein
MAAGILGAAQQFHEETGTKIEITQLTTEKEHTVGMT